MAKLTLNDTTSGYQSPTVTNANNDLIEAAVENTISRDGTTPNTMNAHLDMNSNRVVNVADAVNNYDALNLGQAGALATTDTVLSQGVISGYLWPDTSAEAAVTVYQSWYPPGNVLRYWDGLASDFRVAFQAAADAHPEAMHVPLEQSPYTLSSTTTGSNDACVTLQPGTNLFIEPGVRIQDDGGMGIQNTRILYCDYLAFGVNIVAHGATIAIDQAAYGTLEGKHALDIRGARDVSVYGGTWTSWDGDGCSISGHASGAGFSENVNFYGCTFNDNHRQGMSIVSAKGLRAYGCTFQNTGLTTGGTNPNYGIDIEPDLASDLVQSIHIDSCRFYNNQKTGNGAAVGVALVGTEITESNVSITVSNCVSDTDQRGFAVQGANWTNGEGYVTFENCVAYNSVINAYEVRNWKADLFKVSFINCSVVDCNTSSSAAIQAICGMAIWRSTAITDTYVMGNVYVENFDARDTRATSEMLTGILILDEEAEDADDRTNAAKFSNVHINGINCVWADAARTNRHMIDAGGVARIDDPMENCTFSVTANTTLHSKIYARYFDNLGAADLVSITLKDQGLDGSDGLNGLQPNTGDVTFTNRNATGQIFRIFTDADAASDGGVVGTDVIVLPNGGSVTQLSIHTYGDYVTLRKRSSNFWQIVDYSGANIQDFNKWDTFLAADTTPSVKAGSHFKSGAADTYTDFDDGTDGQIITITSDHACAYNFNGTGLVGNGGTVTTSVGDIAMFQLEGTLWRLLTLAGNTGNPYTAVNVTPDRVFDADTVAVAELADIVGTLISDLQGKGIIG